MWSFDYILILIDIKYIMLLCVQSFGDPKLGAYLKEKLEKCNRKTVDEKGA